MSYHQPQTPELSVPALVNWLSLKNHDQEYIYQDPARCLLGHYLSDQGADEAISEAAYETMPDYRAIAEPKPHTFGAALERAEALLALPPPSAVPLREQPLLLDATIQEQEVPEKQATPSAR